LNAGEGFGNSGVNGGVVKFVGAVVSQEIVEGFVEEGFVFGIAEGAANEHGGAIANVGGDDFVGQFGALKVAKGGIHGMNEVEAGIYQSSIQVEYDELDGAGIESTRHNRKDSKEEVIDWTN
jgi:hypothetical protein